MSNLGFIGFSLFSLEMLMVHYSPVLFGHQLPRTPYMAICVFLTAFIEWNNKPIKQGGNK